MDKYKYGTYPEIKKHIQTTDLHCSWKVFENKIIPCDNTQEQLAWYRRFQCIQSCSPHLHLSCQRSPARYNYPAIRTQWSMLWNKNLRDWERFTTLTHPEFWSKCSKTFNIFHSSTVLLKGFDQWILQEKWYLPAELAVGDPWGW